MNRLKKSNGKAQADFFAAPFLISFSPGKQLPKRLAVGGLCHTIQMRCQLGPASGDCLITV